MVMYKIRITDESTSDKLTLWRMMEKWGVVATRMRANPELNEYFINVDGDNLEKLLIQQDTIREEYGFRVELPLNYGADRALILRNVDSAIVALEEQELTTSIEAKNNIKIKSLKKFNGNSKLIKIIVETREMATKATTEGIVILSQQLEAKNVEKEIAIHLTPCYRCFRYNHTTEDCRYQRDYKVCSICSYTGHTHRECNGLIVKCLNCQEQHPTLSNKCKIRKNIIRQRVTETRNKRSSQEKEQKTNIEEKRSSRKQQSKQSTPINKNKDEPTGTIPKIKKRKYEPAKTDHQTCHQCKQHQQHQEQEQEKQIDQDIDKGMDINNSTFSKLRTLENSKLQNSLKLTYEDTFSLESLTSSNRLDEEDEYIEDYMTIHQTTEYSSTPSENSNSTTNSYRTNREYDKPKGAVGGYNREIKDKDKETTDYRMEILTTTADNKLQQKTEEGIRSKPVLTEQQIQFCKEYENRLRRANPYTYFLPLKF